MLKKLALIICVASLGACAMKTTHFVNGNSLEGTRAITDNTDYFIGGIFQDENINVSASCGSSDKIVATQTYRSSTNFWLSLLSLGIYTPQEQTVYCSN